MPTALARNQVLLFISFHRRFFIMPTLARFELETHQRIEKGQALTADSMIELMADLFSEGFAGEMDLDRERVGSTWGTFTTHLYIHYYSFQYAIGISAANAIAKRILKCSAGSCQLSQSRFLQIPYKSFQDRRRGYDQYTTHRRCICRTGRIY